MLGEDDARYLRALRLRQRLLLGLGLVLFLAGGLYGGWGATRLGAEESPSLDPVGRLALLFAPYEEDLGEVVPETDQERALLGELREQTRATSGLVVFTVRFLIANAVVTLGLVLLATALAQRRLLAMLEALRRVAED